MGWGVVRLNMGCLCSFGVLDSGVLYGLVVGVRCNIEE